MKLKHFESILSEVTTFSNPKYQLEQYPTSPHIASRILFSATEYGDIENKSVLDLGCGTGMLGIGAQIMGSSSTTGVDIDPDALEQAADNIENLEVDMDLVNGYVNCETMCLRKGLQFDTVVMNPPFGTRTKGADVTFLEVARQYSSHAIYSLHKTSTREFLSKKAKEWGMEFEVIAQLRFDIPKMYKFHKKQSADVEVDLLRFCKSSDT